MKNLTLEYAVFAGLAVLTLGSFPARTWADGKPAHSEVVQTFEPARNNGTPLVQVRFSNTVIGTFIVDTGEIESVITEPFARKANFQIVEDENSLAVGLHHVRFVQAPEIKLANLTVTQQTFRVVSQDFLPSFNGRPIDGILGGNFLSQFALRIDYPAHEIDWITPGNLDDKSAAELGFTPGNRIALSQEISPWVTLKISHYSLRADCQNGADTASEDMFIDTGSLSTLVSADLTTKLSLRSLASESIKILDRPAAPYNHSTIQRMQIGQSVLTDVAVLAAQGKDTGIPSILGENVLSDCVVLFDFGPHRFYLKLVLPPARAVSAAPLDRAQIAWDRLRAAPDQPTVEDMLGDGFAPEAQDNLSERAARLQTSEADSAKNVERLEKLGTLLHDGQDEAGAKAAFAQAITLSASAAQAHPEDGALAEQWVEALTYADRYEEAVAAATQATVRLPSYAPGWRLLGNALTSQVISILVGRSETVTEKQVQKISQQAQETRLTPAQAALLQTLSAQAHAAFDKAIALAPADASSYRDRALFRLISRAALSAIQQANLKVVLPAPDVPSEETALALAVADWQQWASLNPDSTETLSIAAFLDQNLTNFHDRSWLSKHLKNADSALPATLLTAKSVEDRLMLLTQNKDKVAAASAWAALGRVQAGEDAAGKNEAAETRCESSWRQALALDPAQSDALTALAAYLKQKEKWAELRDLLTSQASAHDTVPVRLTLACVLSGEGLPAEAEAQVRAAKALSPDNAGVNLLLADLLLARSSGDAAALSEAAVCLGKARQGYGTLATPEQKATLVTSEAVWLALDHDPDAAEKQLVALAREQPNCTQAREALAALVPY